MKYKLLKAKVSGRWISLQPMDIFFFNKLTVRGSEFPLGGDSQTKLGEVVFGTPVQAGALQNDF